MKTFMAVFTGTPGAFEKYQQQFPDPAKREANERAGMEAWMKWGEAHAKAIVDNGAGHAHFTIFPGDGVEIMECLPIPQMP